MNIFKLVYKNMITDCSKVGLYGLLFMAGFCTVNTFMSAMKFGLVTAWFMGGLSFFMWIVVLPFVFTLIDTYKSPQRLEKILNENKNGR